MSTSFFLSVEMRGAPHRIDQLTKGRSRPDQSFEKFPGIFDVTRKMSECSGWASQPLTCVRLDRLMENCNLKKERENKWSQYKFLVGKTQARSGVGRKGKSILIG